MVSAVELASTRHSRPNSSCTGRKTNTHASDKHCRIQSERQPTREPSEISSEWQRRQVQAKDTRDTKQSAIEKSTNTNESWLTVASYSASEMLSSKSYTSRCSSDNSLSRFSNPGIFQHTSSGERIDDQCRCRTSESMTRTNTSR